MTGPEHYREAERLLSGAQNVMDVAPVDGLTRTECAALAQVHATLAAAAATALIDETPRGDCFANYQAWQVVAGAGGAS
jgi:invasion protein IalB